MSSESVLEFRAGDDAWYSVRVELEGEEEEEVLRVKYLGFSEEEDNKFRASDFKSGREVEKFKDRFRAVSVQVQDSDCSKVVTGNRVCASYSDRDDDVRFYDAFVDGVERREHARKEDGEEECSCIFIVSWLHGPNVGNLTTTSIENICQVQSSAPIDPKVTSFLKVARERFIINSEPVLISKADSSSSIKPFKRKFSSFEHLNQEKRCAKRTLTKICPPEGRIASHLERTMQDTDLGGVGSHFVILLENLDKGLSPLSVAEFIHRETSISPQVYVIPNLTSEPSTQGALVLDCEKKFQKLSDFLDNSNHIIMSSRERPWVIIETMSGHNALRASTWIQTLDSQRMLRQGSNIGRNELKVVHFGSEEYERARLLKDLFVEFFNHQKGLQKRLALDVGKIMLQHPRKCSVSCSYASD
ncbi:uncharacterized protein LOC132180743 isoform X2 [Corylus avellana]|uniref:uncharacterized protein LOC132180743 isoform X2 n=1 Tax=Corylus avellana TaxID=13451 RepID=UPI00286D028A|nr:uncharacterized protein LOC132180743 isoform X2 [Corylus avellana]